MAHGVLKEGACCITPSLFRNLPNRGCCGEFRTGAVFTNLICHGNTLPPSPLQIRYEVVGSSFIAVAVVPISSSFFRSLSLMDEGAEKRGRRRHRYYGVTLVANLVQVLTSS